MWELYAGSCMVSHENSHRECNRKETKGVWKRTGCMDNLGTFAFVLHKSLHGIWMSDYSSVLIRVESMSWGREASQTAWNKYNVKSSVKSSKKILIV